ncbi:HAD family hydrolase [Catenovulum sediminis]|uniref:HAD family phosphatase n=1 Tax=Catenovulum sediminis TaxID=1740262 RepID=A0ABV1RBZ8_9ALTE|nr:HAD family phosphatase [Catenovulum sediminis]
MNDIYKITQKPDAILFDMDGTIFDSEAIYCQAWVDTADKFGQHFTASMYDDFVGVRSEECYRIAAKLFDSTVNMNEFIRQLRADIEHKKQLHLPIKKGFDGFFQQCVASGLKVGLVTSSRQAAVAFNFEQLSYQQHFSVIVCAEDVTQPKPAPECYIKACELIGSRPQNTFVFEDSNPGALAGINASCRTIIIPDYLPIHESIQEQAEAVVRSFDEVQLNWQ